MGRKFVQIDATQNIYLRFFRNNDKMHYMSIQTPEDLEKLRVIGKTVADCLHT